MDVDDAITLTLAIWVFLCTVFVTLLLIGLLVVAEVGGYFINPQTKKALNSAIYFLLFLFLIVVIRKVMEVLG